MKTCSLNDFMEEIRPWLDDFHIREAHIDEKDRFVLKFKDGMKNVYHIDDCNREQVEAVLKDLGEKGIKIG